MFLNALPFLHRRPPPDHEQRFVEEIRAVRRVPLRNRRVEWVILGCWLAIALKCWGVIWLVERYHIQINPLWVNAPTIVFALLCTAVYFFRE